MERARGNSAEFVIPAERTSRAPASPAHAGGHHEGDHLGPRHVDPGQGGGDLVVAHGPKRPTEPARNRLPSSTSTIRQRASLDPGQPLGRD